MTDKYTIKLGTHSVSVYKNGALDVVMARTPALVTSLPELVRLANVGAKAEQAKAAWVEECKRPPPLETHDMEDDGSRCRVCTMTAREIAVARNAGYGPWDYPGRPVNRWPSSGGMGLFGVDPVNEGRGRPYLLAAGDEASGIRGIDPKSLEAWSKKILSVATEAPEAKPVPGHACCDDKCAGVEVHDRDHERQLEESPPTEATEVRAESWRDRPPLL